MQVIFKMLSGCFHQWPEGVNDDGLDAEILPAAFILRSNISIHHIKGKREICLVLAKFHILSDFLVVLFFQEELDLIRQHPLMADFGNLQFQSLQASAGGSFVFWEREAVVVNQKHQVKHAFGILFLLLDWIILVRNMRYKIFVPQRRQHSILNWVKVGQHRSVQAENDKYLLILQPRLKQLLDEGQIPVDQCVCYVNKQVRLFQ